MKMKLILSITVDTPKYHDKAYILDFNSYNKIYELKKVLIKFPYWFRRYCKIEILKEIK